MTVVHCAIKAIAGGKKIETGWLVIIRSTLHHRARHDVDCQLRMVEG
jgi:hypothetical protein